MREGEGGGERDEKREDAEVVRGGGRESEQEERER